MKLVYLTNNISGPGGLERVISLKANYLIQHLGYEIHIISLNEAKPDPFYEFDKNIIFHNVDVTGSPLAYIFKYITKVKKFIKQIKPDVISVCDDGLKGFFAPIVIGKTCPIIYERHVSKKIAVQTEQQNNISKIATKCKFALMDKFGKKFDYFVVLTDGNLKEWKLKNIKVIPNPLSFYPKEQSTLRNKKVLAVGKHGFQKGYDRLLKSWQLVQKKHPDWQLDIYGTIYEEVGLKQLSIDLEIEDSVHFYEPVKNIAEKYEESSIYVMSSRYEGFGMVLTEAMSYGVPCVSFDCPHGPADIISHGNDGLLVANNDVQGLSEALLQLIENPKQRLKMGALARENVQRFSIENIAEEWNNLFNSLIKR
jgi:glycosyltransferase involved in cell wall biosynthesis